MWLFYARIYISCEFVAEHTTFKIVAGEYEKNGTNMVWGTHTIRMVCEEGSFSVHEYFVVCGLYCGLHIPKFGRPNVQNIFIHRTRRPRFCEHPARTNGFIKVSTSTAITHITLFPYLNTFFVPLTGLIPLNVRQWLRKKCIYSSCILSIYIFILFRRGLKREFPILTRNFYML